MISDYINNSNSLPKNPGYNTAQRAMCQFMNYCSNHGTCDQTKGVCKCDDDYFGEDCSRTLSQSLGQDIDISILPQQWYYFKRASNPKKSQHLSFSNMNDQKFSIYGMIKKNGNLKHIPDKKNFDYKISEVNDYVHYFQQQSSEKTISYQIIGVYNPSFINVSNIRISEMTIYGQVQKQKEKSFWSPPNFGFWIFIIIVVGTVISLSFNYYHYRIIKRLQKHSYTRRDLTYSTNFGTNIESKIGSRIQVGNQEKNKTHDDMKQKLLNKF